MELTNEYWGKAKWGDGTELPAKAEDLAFESGSQVQVQALPLISRAGAPPHSASLLACVDLDLIFKGPSSSH